jgi:hypothetical protein
MIHLDHTEPPVPSDVPNRPPPPPPVPGPDVVPVEDPQRPEHPDPVREPPDNRPPVAVARQRAC